MIEFLNRHWSSFLLNWQLNASVLVALLLLVYVFHLHLKFIYPRHLEREMARKGKNRYYAQQLETFLNGLVEKKALKPKEREELLHKIGRAWGISEYIKTPRQRLIFLPNGKFWPIPFTNLSKTKAAILSRLGTGVGDKLAKMKRRRLENKPVVTLKRKEITTL